MFQILRDGALLGRTAPILVGLSTRKRILARLEDSRDRRRLAIELELSSSSYDHDQRACARAPGHGQLGLAGILTGWEVSTVCRISQQPPRHPH